ncbi:MAG: glycerophosphodiester phosphodiesterase family protein [Lachnospiraceae bacterium]|nr:glycerophosphodiester phosphodiesterase family protein [Lachnospiraceae bacterium]
MKFDIREAAKERVILCAHRGVWGGNIPCNNILAYDIALSQGADMVEIDVTMAADGELFIFHPGMEQRHLALDVHLEKMTTAEIKELRYCNYDGVPTEIPLNTLDEVLEHLKGRCFINVDKFGDHPAEIIEKIKRHDMKDQIILKCAPGESQLATIEKYAPDIQFLPIIREDNGIHEMLKKRNINYIGSELLFTNMDSELAGEEYRDKMHRDGKLCWVNTIVYNYKAVLSAFHSDDTALAGNPEFGWGWCADNFDIIQTDWVGAVSQYLDKTGKRWR